MSIDGKFYMYFENFGCREIETDINKREKSFSNEKGYSEK